MCLSYDTRNPNFNIFHWLFYSVKSFASPGKMFLVVSNIYIILLLSTAPLYAVNRLAIKFSPVRNKTLLGRIFMGNREEVESISYAMNNFFSPVTAFVIILICTVTLAIKLHRGTAWRKRSTASGHVDWVSTRNQKVAKTVVMISTLFIVCCTHVCILIVVVAFDPAVSFGGKYFKIALITGGLGFLLESINSSCNIFIYLHMSSKYRETFLNIFSMPICKN